MADEGTMRIHVLEAHLTHKTQLIGKMDPYVVLKSREQEWKTPVCENGGKEPKWHHVHWDCQVHYLGDDLEFHVMDDEIGKDNKIGHGKTKLSALAVHGGFDEWFEIEFEGHAAGKLHLKAEWHPKNHH